MQSLFQSNAIPSVLLIEDDEAECQAMRECFGQRDDIYLCETTHDSESAVSYVRDHAPDAVILDLELHRGSGSGITFLTDLQKCRSKLPRWPYILVTTHNPSQTTHQAARRLGADYILYKHQTDYSPQMVADLLSDMLCVLSNPSLEPRISPTVLRRTSIFAALNRLHINSKLLGYHYLAEGIELYLDGHTRRLFDIIAQSHGKSSASVERAMQHAITRTWNTVEIDVLLENYHGHIDPDKANPTVMEFIAYYANEIRNNQ